MDDPSGAVISIRQVMRRELDLSFTAARWEQQWSLLMVKQMVPLCDSDRELVQQAKIIMMQTLTLLSYTCEKMCTT